VQSKVRPSLLFVTIIKRVLTIFSTAKHLMPFPASLQRQKLSLLDIGARGGIGQPWDTIKSSDLNVILVEPDPIEAEVLKQNHQGDILPYALWSEETELILNINNSPGTSSVLEPNMAFLRQFDDSERFEAQSKITISTKTIDDLFINSKLTDVDFMKIDIQGAELNVLKGGLNYLKNNLVGLESEVEFATMYQNQPLFSELEIFVRQELGLELWDIRKTYWKYSQKHYKNPTKGRLIFGDALFLRPISKLDDWLIGMDGEKAKIKLNMLIATSLAYGYLDYAYAIVDADFINKYMTNEDKKNLIASIDKLHRSIYPFKNGLSLIYMPLHLLANCFKPNHKGWGSADNSNHLGSRKKGYFWF